MVRKETIWSYLEPFPYSDEYLHLAEISKKLNKAWHSKGTDSDVIVIYGGN